jgi:hypothetical protein
MCLAAPLSRWPERDSYASGLVGLVPEQFLEIIGDGAEQHGLVGGPALSADAPHAVLVEQVAKDGFGPALADAAHALPGLGALPMPRPAVGRIKRRANQLFVLRPQRTARAQRTLLAILVGRSVQL